MSDYAKGFYVKGPGEGGDDKIPVMIGRGEQWLTADQVRKLATETRGGDEPLDWRVNPDAIAEAEDRGEGE